MNSDDQDLWLQARLVAGGHARVALTPETSPLCAKALLAHEAAAERDSRGLWGEALYRAKPAGEPRALLAYRSTYQIVAGTIARVAVQRSAIYLNFSDDWQRDFTARIAPGVLKRAGLSTDVVKRLENRPVRVRGWIERRRGPLIIVWRPEQVELLEPAANRAPRRLIPPVLLSDLARSSAATAIGSGDGGSTAAPPPATSPRHPPNENAPVRD